MRVFKCSVMRSYKCHILAYSVFHGPIFVFTNLHFSLHFMVLLSDYPSLFSFSLWVVCRSLSLHARCTFTVQQTMLRCSRQLCCPCLHKQPQPQTWLSGIGYRSVDLLVFYRMILLYSAFHCCWFEISATFYFMSHFASYVLWFDLSYPKTLHNFV